jgi:hypothetical protein
MPNYNYAQQAQSNQIGAMTAANTKRRNMSTTGGDNDTYTPDASDAVNALKQNTAQQASQVASRQMAKTSKTNKAFFGD